MASHFNLSVTFAMPNVSELNFSRASIAAALALVLAGCQTKDSSPHDEATARYLRENPGTSPAEASKQAVGKYKLFPEHSGNYFRGMDDEQRGNGNDHTNTDNRKAGDQQSAKKQSNASKAVKRYSMTYSPAEWRGRNTWLMWTGGNQAFWDYLARDSNGLVDLLRLLDARHVARRDRFRLMGLVPEPGMRQSNAKNAKHGLWLDVPAAGGKSGGYVRGDQPNPDVYGRSSGIVGLRLFDNPAFDEAAAEKWNPQRYLYDEKYYKDPKLVRPYRVGMACAFCHVSYNPLNPPDDPANPAWEHLASNVGNQYFRVSRIFGYDMRKDSLIWQLLNSSRPGTIDTSLIATDGNNNPNTMNSVYGVLDRVVVSLLAKSAEETVSESTKNYLRTLDGLEIAPDVAARLDNETVKLLKKREFLEIGPKGVIKLRLPSGKQRRVPHILAVGEDSVGTFGALCRVYLNIGEYHQQWVRTHNLMYGLDAQKPFRVKTAKENSAYWNASEQRATNLAKFFLKSSLPRRLEDAKGVDPIENDGKLVGYGIKFTNKEGTKKTKKIIDMVKAKRGELVFARKCFVCHSSKQPARFWENPTDYRHWISDEQYVAKAKEMVQKKGFRDGNYFSTDQRYPVSLIGTHAGRSLADNALKGRVWEDFASETYREFGAKHGVTGILVDHPYEKRRYVWKVPRKRRSDQQPGITELYGPGFYRPHTLISIWSTAPFLHNNSVGNYPKGFDPGNDQQPDVSVAGRLKVFEDSAEKLLWPEKRAGRKSIYRTTSDSSLQVPFVLLRSVVRKITGYEPVLIFHENPWLFPLFVGLFGIAIFLWGRERPRVALKLAGCTFLGLALLLWWELQWNSFNPHVGYGGSSAATWAAWLRVLVPLLLGIGLVFRKLGRRRLALALYGLSFATAVAILIWELRATVGDPASYATTWNAWIRVVLFALLGIGLVAASRRLELAITIAGGIVILFGLTLFSTGWLLPLLVIGLGVGIYTGATSLTKALRIVGTVLLLIAVVFGIKNYNYMFALYPVVTLILLGVPILIGVVFLWAAKRPSFALRFVGRIVVLAAIGSFFIGAHLRRNGVTVGYIPEGTPINLVASINGPGLYEDKERLNTLVEVVADLAKVQKHRLPTLHHPKVPNLVPNLLKINKCPDFVLDHGHTFGSELSDEEKWDLIEYLKTL